jgi:hypothetical protein
LIHKLRVPRGLVPLGDSVCRFPPVQGQGMPVAAQEAHVLAKLLEAADVVLADGRAVVAKRDSEEELFWALRGGGGNFGIVTAMCPKLHRPPSVRTACSFIHSPRPARPGHRSDPPSSR